MKNIFLSVLTNVPEGYNEGYENFINVLKLQRLVPRTLGQTDFAGVTPFEEVLELMYQCEGAIILGFPQLTVNEAELNGSKVNTPITLATEWNHIEGSIAVAIGLPVLLICDKSVSRGLFDKGGLNKFLYQVDLTDSSWSTSSQIVGAIQKWQLNLKVVEKPKRKSLGLDQPKLKWGCFVFPDDKNLYCPYCFNRKGEKFLTTRIDIKSRQCTNCKSKISGG